MRSSKIWKTNGSADWAPSMEPLVLMKGTKLEEGPGAVTKRKSDEGRGGYSAWGMGGCPRVQTQAAIVTIVAE